MYQTHVLWNDEAMCRQVVYRADYSIVADMLHILDVTPLRVGLIDSMTGTITNRKINVLTKRTQKILKNRFVGSGMLESLVKQIAANHDLTVITQES